MERHSGAFTVLFRQGRRVVRLHVRGAARQDEEKLGERAREWRCIMKRLRSPEPTLGLRFHPRQAHLVLPFFCSRERVFCKTPPRHGD